MAARRTAAHAAAQPVPLLPVRLTRQADIVSLHAPLLPSTFHIINGERCVRVSKELMAGRLGVRRRTEVSQQTMKAASGPQS